MHLERGRLIEQLLACSEASSSQPPLEVGENSRLLQALRVGRRRLTNRKSLPIESGTSSNLNDPDHKGQLEPLKQRPPSVQLGNTPTEYKLMLMLALVEVAPPLTN